MSLAGVGAVFCLLIALSVLPAYLRCSPTRTAPDRVVRTHVRYLMFCWLVLAAYYGLAALLGPLQLADLNNIPLPESMRSAAYAWHGLSIATCWITNTYLRRSLSYLESERAEDPQGRARVRLLRNASDAGLIAALLSLSLLLIPLLLPKYSSNSVFVALAYLPQFLLAGLLVSRLANGYEVLGAPRPALAAIRLYALLQCISPIGWLLPTMQPEAAFVLQVPKLFIAVALPVALRAVRRSCPAPSDIQSRLRDLGDRLDQEARLKRSVRTALLVFLVVGLTYLVSLATTRVYRLHHPVHSRAFELGLLFAGSLLGLQTLVYLVKRKTSVVVGWRRLADGLLNDWLIVDAPFKRNGWENLALSRSQRSEGRIQVVLLHGLLSSGPQAWGLLPAVLLETELVGRVHLLTYHHNLWSSGNRFAHVQDEWYELLDQIANAWDGVTVVFAHSLGSLLMLKALNHAIAADNQRLIRRLRNVVCVAPPFHGSWWALLGFPFPWPRHLMPSSSFVEDTVNHFFKTFPPPGWVVGEESVRCTVSVLQASRDTIVGTSRPFRGLPSRPVKLSGWHSSPNEVYHMAGEQAEAYRSELLRPTRATRLMTLLCSHLAGRRTRRRGWVFELERSDSLRDALVVLADLAEWGRLVQDSPHRDPDVTLYDALLSEFREESGGEDLEWAAAWEQIETAYAISREKYELVRADWPQRSDPATLYLFATQDAGFALLVDEDLKRMRGQEKGPEVAPANPLLQPIVPVSEVRN